MAVLTEEQRELRRQERYNEINLTDKQKEDLGEQGCCWIESPSFYLKASRKPHIMTEFEELLSTIKGLEVANGEDLCGGRWIRESDVSDAIDAFESGRAKLDLPVDWDWLVSHGGVETSQYANVSDVKMLHWPGVNLFWREQSRSSDGIDRVFVIGKSGYVGHLNRGGFLDLLRVLQSST